MKLKEILDKASKGYGVLGVEYDDAGKFERGKACDTLAEFVVIEITESYDADAEDHDQLAEARRVLTIAVRELEGAIDALTS